MPDRLPAEAAERPQRLVDKVLTGTAGRVELGTVVLGQVKEPVALVVDTDRKEVAALAELLVGQLRVLRFLADAGLAGQHFPSHWIVAVPELSGLAVQCTDLLKPY